MTIKEAPSLGPTISAELIAWLETNYPDKAQDISMPQREADARFGEIRLVRSLRALHDRQQRTILSPSDPERVLTTQTKNPRRTGSVRTSASAR